MRAVIVPPHAGVFSAVGLVSAPRRRELVKTWATPASTAGLEGALEALGREAAAAVGGAELVETFVDCRYAGQSHELTVGNAADFAAEHERRNGYARPGAPVEVVAIRARASRAAPLTVEQLPAGARPRVEGPHVAVEPDCTVWVPDGWVAEPAALGAWVMVRA
jgi:N-methylhydantoinase A/oxoprolinase/acetone carboxylase beta subunit